MSLSESLPTSDQSRRHVSVENRQIHVVHLVSALNVGGLEQVVMDLARRTDRTSFRVTVVCIKERGIHADRVESHGIPVTSLDCGVGGIRRVVPSLIRLLRRLRPDVLHTHNPHPHFVGAIAGTLLWIPAIINTKHGRNKPEVRSAVRANRLASLLSHKVIAVSDDAARVAIDIERVPRRKVTTIHNGIDLSQFPLPDRTSHQGPVRAIHVARLNIVKDQKTLLEAVRIVVDRVPEFHLVIAGDGPMRAELLALRDRLGLRSNVEFLGDRRDIAELLAASDVFVLSSVKEGLSITLLEAMASGLAVVATDVGGNREVVEDGRTGLLVPSRSPARLAEALHQLIQNPHRAREMGISGRDRIERMFDIEQSVRQYEDCYRLLVMNE